jgi:hypothetical protein
MARRAYEQEEEEIHAASASNDHLLLQESIRKAPSQHSIISINQPCSSSRVSTASKHSIESKQALGSPRVSTASNSYSMVANDTTFPPAKASENCSDSQEYIEVPIEDLPSESFGKESEYFANAPSIIAARIAVQK